MSDGELVRRTLAGRTEAYAELVRRWTGRVLALCHAKTGRAGAAEDLAQEALLRGFRALKSLADAERFGAWLCGIAGHVCLDWLKHKNRTEIPFSAMNAQQNIDQLLCEQTPDTNMNQEEEVQKLLAEVESLPEEYREVVMLYYYDDVTYRDVAQTLGVSTATVNARLTKARALLRQRLTRSRGGDA